MLGVVLHTGGSALGSSSPPQPVPGTSLFVGFGANSEMAQDAETRKCSAWHVC